MSVQIRRAGVADKLSVVELTRDFATSFETDDEMFSIAFDELIVGKDVTFLVAVESEVVVGYCLGFHHQTLFANGLVSWVEETAVAENQHGKGIGQKLIEEFEKEAKIRDSRLVAMATRRASDFYTKLGYEESAVYFRKII
ncbi:GNAT family N-acetyltransferase [Candidatus Saccharibacteria bacterium]|jgi:GNAT superfamily N-acetyltransferase|nr:GNAT family N-acetyltransferase [Candidatus Saccharibacteria bacterium]MBP9132178.1 GNAT family N-acetyltransferase [Candidatus Saccharibacteria bacterium]